MSQPIIQQIALNKIDPDPNQPRENFAMVEILAESMKNLGQLKPVLLLKTNERFTIIAGECRYHAAELLEWKSLDAIVIEDGEKAVEMQVDENLCRLELDAFEEARAYQRLSSLGFSHKKIATRFGKNRTYVSQALGLLRIPRELRDQIRLKCQNSDIRAASEALFRLSRLPRVEMQNAWEAYLAKGRCDSIKRAKDRDGRTKQAKNEKPSSPRGIARYFDTKFGRVEIYPSGNGEPEELLAMLAETEKMIRGVSSPVRIVAMPADMNGEETG